MELVAQFTVQFNKIPSVCWVTELSVVHNTAAQVKHIFVARNVRVIGNKLHTMT